MTHETDEDLSALMDGELPAAAAARVRAHTASCAECAARSARLSAAGAAFRRSGERPVPEGLTERARDKAGKRGIKSTKIAAMALKAALVAALTLLGGVTLKKLMPSLFNDIQGTITGAATQLGNGEK